MTSDLPLSLSLDLFQTSQRRPGKDAVGLQQPDDAAQAQEQDQLPLAAKKGGRRGGGGGRDRDPTSLRKVALSGDG